MNNSFEAYFQTTALEATELHTKSKALSEAFVVLRNAYSTDYLTETQQYADKKDANQFRENKISRLWGTATNRLSNEAQTMWKAFEKCNEAYNDFSAVCRAHSIQGEYDETITKTFEIRHENGDLYNPETVIEGRRVYETLEKHKNLIKHIGFMGF